MLLSPKSWGMTLIVALVYTYVMSSCHALPNVLQNAVDFDIHYSFFISIIKSAIIIIIIIYNQIYYHDYHRCITIITAFYCRYIIIVYIYYRCIFIIMTFKGILLLLYFIHCCYDYLLLFLVLLCIYFVCSHMGDSFGK